MYLNEFPPKQTNPKEHEAVRRSAWTLALTQFAATLLDEVEVIDQPQQCLVPAYSGSAPAQAACSTASAEAMDCIEAICADFNVLFAVPSALGCAGGVPMGLPCAHNCSPLPSTTSHACTTSSSAAAGGPVPCISESHAALHRLCRNRHIQCSFRFDSLRLSIMPFDSLGLDRFSE